MHTQMHIGTHPEKHKPKNIQDIAVQILTSFLLNMQGVDGEDFEWQPEQWSSQVES